MSVSVYKRCSRKAATPCAWCTLADKLRRLKQRSGKSLRRLERDTFLSDSTISRYINREILPDWLMLECLLEALGGDKQEFRILWERSRFDACVPKVYRNSGNSDVIADGAYANGSSSNWIDNLVAAVEHCDDDKLAKILDTILILTRQIEETRGVHTSRALRQARAACWLEIASVIDTRTTTGRICAQACKYAGEVDSVA
ncbi:MAG TPA: helix-turn-helix transcriptional regulator [Streptosporangiaceae bacterium]|jgi:transcriptional regulator with XRE-family HTH domain|nr:helix-turn-helix transcriptional regulator [Streptosporangiaceae bacterium]